MYGWCGKCRDKYREEYDNLVGWEMKKEEEEKEEEEDVNDKDWLFQ